MAVKSKVISVYGIPDKTPEEELNGIKRMNGEAYLYMKALIEAEFINPHKEMDYDGNYRYEWMKKIAVCETTPQYRQSLIDLFESKNG